MSIFYFAYCTCTVKVPKFSDTKNIAIKMLKLKQIWLKKEKCRQTGQMKWRIVQTLEEQSDLDLHCLVSKTYNRP